MALPSSGTLKLSDIQKEFGGSNPIKLSEYYSVDAGVPNSGTIKVSDFYGTSNITPYGYKDFTTTGWTDWEVPPGVRTICVVTIAGGGGGGAAVYGGGGGGGGGLTYVNYVPVTQGSILQIYVGKGGASNGRDNPDSNGDGGAGEHTSVRYKNGNYFCRANGGAGGKGRFEGRYGKNAGGAGGAQWSGSLPAGASGYANPGSTGGSGYDDWAGGGAGGPAWAIDGSNNAGRGGSEHPDEKIGGQNGKNGGGGGGSVLQDNSNGGGATSRNGRSGGGTGLKQGNSGAGGGASGNGKGGSGGEDGSQWIAGSYGAGGGGTSEDSVASKRGAVGSQGACRIIWGTGKNFPNNF